jgi:hypothetical protein
MMTRAFTNDADNKRGRRILQTTETPVEDRDIWPKPNGETSEWMQEQNTHRVPWPVTRLPFGQMAAHPLRLQLSWRMNMSGKE